MTRSRYLLARTARVALMASVLYVAGCGGDRQDDSEAVSGSAGRDETRENLAGPRGCEVGDRRAVGRGPEVVIGCGRALGEPVRILAFRDAGGPCLLIAGLRGGTRGCGRAPSERVPAATEAIGGPAIVRRSPDRPLELYGETTADVRRVVLRYRRNGRDARRREAALIEMRNPAALRAAGIRESFGYFVGSVPPGATNVSAEALAASGAVLDRFRFGRLAREMHPTVFIASKTAEPSR